MAGLNFGSLKTVQATSTTARRLKPWDIYEVTFSGCRKEVIQGKKDPEKSYEILKIRFDGEEGYYEESIFYPRNEDAERKKVTNKEGHERELPSSFERTMMLIAQVAKVVNEKGYEKMQELSPKFKSFDDVVSVLIKITDPMKGKAKTHLKLVGRTDKEGNVNAVLPNFCALNKDGEVWCSDNFIGDKLGFSPYEEGQRKLYLNATPTDMNKVKTDVDIEATTEDNKDLETLDTDSLLNDLDL